MRAEAVYRHALLNNPGDTAIRLRLAWCLFAQTIHQAGKESICAALETDSAEPITEAQENACRAGRSVNALLRDCLKQSVTVRQLTRSKWERSDVDLLQSLVEMAGAEDWNIDANMAASRCLYEITHALLIEPDSGADYGSLKRIRESR